MISERLYRRIRYEFKNNDGGLFANWYGVDEGMEGFIFPKSEENEVSCLIYEITNFPIKLTQEEVDKQIIIDMNKYWIERKLGKYLL